MSTGTGSPANWEFITTGETWLETQYETYSREEKLDIISVFAMISLAFGTSNAKELILGAAAFIPQYWIGGNGFDGMISVLAGIQMAKGKFSTAAFPTLYESYKLLKDFTAGKTVTKQGASRAAIYGVGWAAARYKFV